MPVGLRNVRRRNLEINKADPRARPEGCGAGGSAWEAAGLLRAVLVSVYGPGEGTGLSYRHTGQLSSLCHQEPRCSLWRKGPAQGTGFCSF